MGAEVIWLCAECMEEICVCEALEAADALRMLRGRRVTLLELTERMADFDTQWQTWREKRRDANDRRDQVEVIRDPRLT